MGDPTIALHRNELTITTENLFYFAFYRETLNVNITYLLKNPAVYLRNIPIYSLLNLSSALQWIQGLRGELVRYILDTPERRISKLEAEVRFPQCMG